MSSSRRFLTSWLHETSNKELVVSCSECEHSEFVHADREGRPCLFSGCDCSGYNLSITGDIADLTIAAPRP